MNKIIVTEKSINEAIEFFNKFSEKEHLKFYNDFQKEQSHLNAYLIAIYQTYELDEDIFEELLNLSLIVWKSFKITTSFVPEVSEEFIDDVENEADELNKNLADSLGIDLDDENADLSKLTEINKMFDTTEEIDAETLLKHAKQHNLEGFLEKAEKQFYNSQTFLNDFVSDEVAAIEEIEQEDIYLCTEILFDVIKCFDKAVNKSPLKIVK